MSVHEHEETARRERGEASIRAAIVTMSDTRTIEEDTSGDTIERLLGEAGHQVVRRALVPDDPERIRGAITEAITDPAVEVVLMTGGTGLARRDGTVDVLRSFSAIDIEGFGELFRSVSFEEIGAAALLSRACGVIIETADGRRVPAFAMPGSVNAVQTAMNRLIIPVLTHVQWEATR